MTEDSCRRAARATLLQGLLALGLSVLIGVGLSASVNPVDGDVSYDVAEWVRDLLRLVGAGLLAAAAALRALAR